VQQPVGLRHRRRPWCGGFRQRAMPLPYDGSFEADNGNWPRAGRMCTRRMEAYRSFVRGASGRPLTRRVANQRAAYDSNASRPRQQNSVVPSLEGLGWPSSPWRPCARTGAVFPRDVALMWHVWRGHVTCPGAPGSSLSPDDPMGARRQTAGAGERTRCVAMQDECGPWC